MFFFCFRWCLSILRTLSCSISKTWGKLNLTFATLCFCDQWNRSGCMFMMSFGSGSQTGNSQLLKALRRFELVEFLNSMINLIIWRFCLLPSSLKAIFTWRLRWLWEAFYRDELRCWSSFKTGENLLYGIAEFILELEWEACVRGMPIRLNVSSSKPLLDKPTTCSTSGAVWLSETPNTRYRESIASSRACFFIYTL